MHEADDEDRPDADQQDLQPVTASPVADVAQIHPVSLPRFEAAARDRMMDQDDVESAVVGHRVDQAVPDGLLCRHESAVVEVDHDERGEMTGRGGQTKGQAVT